MMVFLKDIIKSMKRRRKEIRLMIFVVFITTFFMNGIALFQKNAETYTFEYNKKLYGEWSIAETYEDKTHESELAKYAYFDSFGTCISGLKMYSKSGQNAGVNIGCMDEEFIKIGHIKLSDGQFPKNNDEIVLDAAALIKLGYTRQIGQNIEVAIADINGKLIKKNYKLVGILKTNVCNWQIGQSMPRAIVTKAELESVEFEGSIAYCYHMAEEYEKADIKEIRGTLYKAHSPSARNGESIVYNIPLYNVSLWGDAKIYSIIETMTLLSGIMAMSFLMISYIQKRKKYYYNYRTIGMSKGQVRSVILLESAYIFIPTQLIAILTVLIGGALISAAITLVNGYKYFYVIPVLNILKMIIAGLLLCVVSTIMALLVNSKNKLYGNNQDISTRFLFRWRMNKLKYYNTSKGLYKREQKIFPLRTVFSIALGIVFSAMLLIATNKLWEEYNDYKWYLEATDIVAVKPENTSYDFKYIYYGPDGKTPLGWGLRYERSEKSLSYGFSQGFFEALKDTAGIKSYELMTVDSMHLFEWDNMDNDPYITTFRDSIFSEGKTKWGQNDEIFTWKVTWGEMLEEKNHLEYGYSSCFIKDTKSVYEKVAKKYSNEFINYDEFKTGQQVFVIMSSMHNSFVKPGTDMRIVVGDEKITVKVSAVIPSDKLNILEIPNSVKATTVGNKMIMVASEELGKRIAAIEGTTFEYNYISLQLKQNVHYATSGDMAANIIISDGGSVDAPYTGYADEISEIRNKMVVYITFMLMLVSFFVIIKINIVQSTFVFNSNRIRRLRLLGMSKRNIKKMNILQALNEAKWIILTIPAVFAYRMQLLFIEYKDNGKYKYDEYSKFWVEELDVYVTDVNDILKYCWERWINVWWMVAVVVIMIIINVIIRYISINHHLKELDKEGFC